MLLEEPTFEWAETPDTISVRFPAPPPKPRSISWTTAVLAAAAVLPLPLTIMLLWRLISDTPSDTTFWWVFSVAIIANGCLIWAALAAVRREARSPARVCERSLLSITGGVLKIERAGRDRDMDYSWELSEIADIRLSTAAPDRIFVGIDSLLAQALLPDEVIRVSVERRSGEVDDVMVFAPGRYWTDALEARLRAYLGLSPAAGTVTEPSGGA